MGSCSSYILITSCLAHFARGANVAISARDVEELSRAATRLHQISDRILTVEADVTMPEEAETVIQKVNDKFGTVDVLGPRPLDPSDVCSSYRTVHHRQSLSAYRTGHSAIAYKGLNPIQ